MTTFIILLALVALLVCLMFGANSKDYRKWFIASCFLAVFILGIFSHDIQDILGIYGFAAGFLAFWPVLHTLYGAWLANSDFNPEKHFCVFRDFLFFQKFDFLQILCIIFSVVLINLFEK